MEKITFFPDKDESGSVEFYVLEQTRLGGTDYILVTDTEDGDGEALILKDTSPEGAEEGVYAVVEDEEELQAVAQVFQSMMEDVTLE